MAAATPMFRWINHINHALTLRLTPLGSWFGVLWIIAGAFGVNTRVGATYQLFVLVTLFFIFAWLASRVDKRTKIIATRELPKFATVDQIMRYSVWLDNLGLKLERDLTLFDELHEAKINVFKPKKIWTYYQWSQYATWLRGAKTGAQPAPPLPPQARTFTELTLTPLRRGWVEFASISLARPEPLGLWRRILRQAAPDRLLVLPRRYQVPPLRFASGRQYQPGGMTLAQSVGEENEFIGLRDYRPGDPPRRLHWRSFAKRSKPIIKEFQDEFFVRYGLLLDNFAAGIEVNRFEAAVSAAASIATAERDADTLLDLLLIGTRAYCVTAGRGLGQTEQLLEILACVTPVHQLGLDSLSALARQHAPTLSACVCVLLNWDAQRRHLIKHLRGHGVMTMVLVIGPPSEPPDPEVRVATPENLPQILANLW